jgi:CheY-like chemotaxis protein
VRKLDVQKIFGTSVRAWRGRLGISQEELADRAGLHRTYVCDVERGARNLSLKSIERLARALQVPVPRLFSSPTEDTQDARLTPVEILFVEDNLTDIDLTLQAFRRFKLANRIQVVQDGEAALNYLFCTGEYQGRAPDRPHVVLLDLGLPRVDGLEVLRRIKADERTRAVPVVVLTASKFDRHISTSQQLGAEAYIVKPVDFQNLLGITAQLSLQWALLKSEAPQPS